MPQDAHGRPREPVDAAAPMKEKPDVPEASERSYEARVIESRSLLTRLRNHLTTISDIPTKESADALHRLTSQLLDITNQLHNIRTESERVHQLFSTWRESNVHHLQQHNDIAGLVSSLDDALSQHRIAEKDISKITTACSAYFDLTEESQTSKHQLSRAIETDDAALAETLLSDWKKSNLQLSSSRDALNAQFENVLSTTSTNNTQAHCDASAANSTSVSLDPKGRIADTKVTQPPDQPTPKIPSPEDKERPSPPSESTNTPRKNGTTGIKGSSNDTNSPNSTSQSQSLPKDLPRKLNPTIVEALERRWLSIAYYLAKADSESLPTVESIEFIAMNFAADELSPISADMHELAARLHDITRDQLNTGELDTPNQSYLVLLIVAAFRPALIVPGSSIVQLISLIRSHMNEFPALQKLAKIIADVSMKGVKVPLDLLGGRSSLEDWTIRETKLRSELKLWMDAEKESRIKYDAATRIWHYMLSSHSTKRRSTIGDLFDKIAATTESDSTDTICAMIEHWRQHANKEIDQIDKSIRPLSSTRKIDGPARIRLKQKIEEAVNLAIRWNQVMTSRPQQATSIQGKLVDSLRNSTRNYADKVRAELAHFDDPLGVYACHLAESYFDLFERSKVSLNWPSMTLQMLLHGDLYALPEVSLTEIGEPSAPPSPDRLTTIMRGDKLTFIEAAKQRAKRGDFKGAEVALDIAERWPEIAVISLDDCRASIESIREDFHENFVSQIQQTSSHLDATYALGALDLSAVDRLRRGVLSLDASHLSQVENFERLENELQAINKEITDARETITKNLKARLRSVSATDSQRELIEAEIDKERYLIADEFIERLAEQKQLPASVESQDSPLRSFFPTFVEEYCSYRSRRSDALHMIVRALSGTKAVGPFNMSELSQDSVHRGIALLEYWIKLTRYDQTSIQTVREILGTLGFTIEQLKRTSSGQIILNTSIIANREMIQLPDFGSRAKGRYAIRIVRGRTSAQSITSEIEPWTGSSKPPVIVIFLNPLNKEQRSALGATFHSAEYTPTVVLDEALLVYLALSNENSLQTFFRCASAFSFAQPFDPNTPQVPVEMFFGRTDERSQILSMTGNFGHLVYGGRRLGKTALMYDIVREYQSSSDTLVIMIDLRGRAVGGGGPTRELWRLVAQELHRRDNEVVGATAARYETIAKGVRDWLEKSADRRILLLIDEADAFLESDRRTDGTPYPVLAEIKRLMEETGRRFKVVFAGLHNVQRVAQDPNTPLAHLGEPVQIGPMLPKSDGGGREIESLIKIPLEALGYQFESPYSVVRIAAETNYYPALVQQFCMELLAELRRSVDSHRGGPPYLISPKSVDLVFNSRQTRDRIRNLFLWTIELDPRYEFLTYLIAFHSFDSADSDVQLRGVDIQEIRDSALEEWPQGFSSNSSYLTFEVLLEEMVGLGILREDSSNGKRSFAIRSRNLRRLLGQDEEIFMRLHDAQSKDAPPTFDPAQYRMTLPSVSGTEPLREPEDSAVVGLCPLTSAQERILLSYSRSSVVLIFGTALAGLDRVPSGVAHMVRRVNEGSDIEGSNIHVEIWPSVLTGDVATVKSALEEIKRGPMKALRVNLHIVLIDVQLRWFRDLVRFAVEFVSGRQPSNRIIRPVLLGGPGIALDWIRTDQTPLRSHLYVNEVWLEICSRDFVRDWLQQRVDRSLADLEDAKYSGDALWPIIVETAASNLQCESISDAVVESLRHGRVDVSEVLCEDRVRQVLEAFVDLQSEDVDLETLSSLLDSPGIAHEDLVKILQWARSLGIVRQGGRGYRIDSGWGSGLKQVLTE